MVAKGLPISSKLTITCRKAEVVLPAVPKEDHAYFLSNLDQLHTTVTTVFLFRAKDGVNADPVAVIKESLQKVLEHYYPLAGRPGISEDGKVQVNYSSQGVVFVEACTESNLEDLGDITKPDVERLGELLYTVPEATNPVDAPLLTAQVTKFRCGGFVLGLAIQHSVLDGISANEFTKAWGETARGLAISTPPFLDRSILKARSPPQIEFPHTEFADIGRLVITGDVLYSFCFSPDDMGVLRTSVMEEGGLKRCTAFEVISALIWKARTMALDMDPEQLTRVYLVVDGRRRFSPQLPSGYLGNVLVLTCATTTSADLSEKPLYHAVKLVQEAIALVDDKYLRSAIDCFETTRGQLSRAGSTFIVTDWTRLQFHSTDFGWGKAWKTGPVTTNRQMVLYVAHGKERKGFNVLIHLPPKVKEAFQKLLKDAL